MTVAEHGVTNHQLQLPAPPLLQPAISQLPLDTRVLLLHHDPAQQQLHLVVLNRPTPTPSPQTDSAAEVAVTTGSKAKDAKTAAQLVAAPADPVSTPSAQSAPLLASMKLSNAELAELLHGFRQYRKWLAKHVLEMTSKVPVPGNVQARVCTGTKDWNLRNVIQSLSPALRRELASCAWSHACACMYGTL